MSRLPFGRATPCETPSLKVGFLLAHQFTISALSLFMDALRLAADEGDRSRPIRCSWSVMAARPEPIRSSCGVTVSRTATIRATRWRRTISWSPTTR